MNKTRRALLHAETARYLALKIADGRDQRAGNPAWRLALEHAHAADRLDPTLDLVNWTEQTLHRTLDHNPRLELLALNEREYDRR